MAEVIQNQVLGHESAGVVSKGLCGRWGRDARLLTSGTVGAKVEHLKVGDRVAMEPGATCGSCDFCKSGRYQVLNKDQPNFPLPLMLVHSTASSFAETLVGKQEVWPFCQFFDHSPVKVFAATPPYDGTLARYYRIPGHVTYQLPDHLTLEDGALVCIRIPLYCSSSDINPED